MLKVFEQLEIPTKDKDGKDSINESIINKSKHEFVPLWLVYIKMQICNNFWTKYLDDKIDGRIYTNFNPMVDTARLSTRRGI
jgi:DNA polymerase I-like protein with 3'-5' exonuclease and polymerase domains